MESGGVLDQADVVMFWALAVLNLSLAVLVGSVRPLRTVNRLLVGMFLLHAVVAVGIPWYNAGDGSDTRAQLVFAVNLATLPLVAALPFVVVRWPRSPAARRAWATAMVVMVAALIVAGPFVRIATGLHFAWWQAAAAFFGDQVRVAIPAIGIILLTRTALRGEGDARRSVAMFLLAAYLLRAGTQYLVPPWIGPPAHDYASLADGAWGWTVARDVSTQVVLYGAVGFAVAACTMAALGRRLAWPRLVFLLGLLALGIAMRSNGWSQEFDYLLLRPLLLAFGVLQFQVVGADVKRNIAVLSVGLVASTAATYLAGRRMAAEAGATEPVEAAVALTLTLAIAVAFLVPLLRLTTSTDDRRLTVYQAALEGSQDATTSLTGLREMLGISDREHAVLTARMARDRDHLAVGTTFLDRYHIESTLGAGAGGTVVHATDTLMGRDVAIKRTQGTAAEREARLSLPHHPNLVAVLGAEVIGDDTYLIMEYVPGGSLRDHLDQHGPMAPAAAARIAVGILDGLAALHAAGTLHRDVKPGNVLLHEAGAKLGDLGIATADGLGGDTMPVGAALPAGTPAYLSPERARGGPATVQSDLWAVAASLYEAVSGAPPTPVQGLDLLEAASRLAEPAALEMAAMGPLAPVLERAFDARPSRRFPDAQTFRAAVEAVVPGRQSR